MKSSLRLEQKPQQRLALLQARFARLLEMNAEQLDQEISTALEAMPALVKTEEPEMAIDSAPDGEGSESKDDVEASANDDYEEPTEREQRAAEARAPLYDPEDEHPDFRLDTTYERADQQPSVTLAEALEHQLTHDTEATAEQQLIARYIIGNLSPSGYLSRSLQSIADDIANAEGTMPSTEAIQQALELVQSLDPPGIGARDLRECLRLQLERQEPSALRDLALKAVKEHFPLLANANPRSLAQALRADIATANAVRDHIRHLDPKPGSRYGSGTWEERSQDRRFPEFYVEVDADTQAVGVKLLGRTPALAVERTMVADIDAEAQMFVNALQLRAQSLAAVVQAIVRRQRQFFLQDDDTAQLRPLLMRDIAADTGLDISVVSRAVSGKYLQTQYGVYPLKFFFNAAAKVSPELPSEATVAQALEALGDIVAHEDPRHPLTDEALAQAMLQRGYNIARRTIAKYRAQLGLVSASGRKVNSE